MKNADKKALKEISTRTDEFMNDSMHKFFVPEKRSKRKVSKARAARLYALSALIIVFVVFVTPLFMSYKTKDVMLFVGRFAVYFNIIVLAYMALQKWIEFKMMNKEVDQAGN